MSEAVDTDLPFYLRGVHAPVREEVEGIDLPIEGTLPPELDGLFLRNGPNPGDDDPGHWFLGDGMLHGVTLREGRALHYRNRYVQTHAIRREAQFVDSRGQADFSASVANTHAIEHAGRILTLAENGFPWEVDANLETIGVYDFDAALEGPMTAHPKTCRETGELHFFGYHFAEPYLVYHRANAEGKLVESRAIDIPQPVMMHDFAITRDFVIFMDLPVVFSPASVAPGAIPYLWSDEAEARLGLLRRNDPTATVQWLRIDPCYVFHSMNAFSEGDRVTLDVVRYNDLWQGGSDSFGIARLHRFEIDLTSGSVRESALDDLGIEFPRIKESLTGSRNRYGYAVWNRDGVSTAGDGLVRYDLENGNRDVFECGAGYVPSEAVFAPAGPDAAEQEGWLLAYFFDRARAKSELAVFDATALSTGPIARIELPQRVPIGFHGSWIPRAGAAASDSSNRVRRAT